VLCEIKYKQQSPEEAEADINLHNHGGCFRVRKIVGRADRIHQFLRKQKDVVAIKILAREANQT
jgi:lipopolysaccharide biosynthesis regulator YciM